MYTFNPIPAVQPDHVGFFLICVLVAFILIHCMLSEPESFFAFFFVATIVVGFTYCVSYIWTDQDVKTYANVQVRAELVGFQPEGYNERSGKSRADRHYIYVVYAVGGEKVILQAKEGTTYPQTAILYKN